MRFEWNARKAKSNIKKYCVTFDEAVTVFYDPLAATFADPDHSDDEDRFITVGYSTRAQLLVICHVERDDATRLMSARRATPKEIKRHENEEFGTTE